MARERPGELPAEGSGDTSTPLPLAVSPGPARRAGETDSGQIGGMPEGTVLVHRARRTRLVHEREARREAARHPTGVPRRGRTLCQSVAPLRREDGRVDALA